MPESIRTQSEDTLGVFLDAWVAGETKYPVAEVTSGTLSKAYQQYCDERNWEAKSRAYRKPEYRKRFRVKRSKLGDTVFFHSVSCSYAQLAKNNKQFKAVLNQ